LYFLNAQNFNNKKECEIEKERQTKIKRSKGPTTKKTQMQKIVEEKLSKEKGDRENENN
jgi:hypothetical protein